MGLQWNANLPVFAMAYNSVQFCAKGWNKILSPLRLPIPPPPQAPQKELSTLPYFTQARSVHTSTQNTR
jgi:hypothetical protein